MEEIIKLDSVDIYNKFRGVSTQHPLVSVVDLSKANKMPAKTFNYGLYAVYLKDQLCGELKYGRRHYDYQEGSLVFVGPGQVLTAQPGAVVLPAKGWSLLFHPDFIKGTHLGRHINEYSFFSYDVNEALHISEEEREIVVDCFKKIQAELTRAIDGHSKTLVASNIELFLNYCNRFYDRQFITRDNVHKGVIEKFESLLQVYFSAEQTQLPSVAWCAGQLNLSPNYFGDLVKKETGRSAQEYIQDKVIDMAKGV